MKLHLTLALVCSATFHVVCLVVLWFVLSVWRPAEVAIHRGGIVLKAVMERAPSAEHKTHWHVHAPFVKSDHQHRHADGEIVLHSHEPMPEVSPREEPTNDASRVAATKVEPPLQAAAVAVLPEVILPPPVQRVSDAPEQETAANSPASRVPRSVPQPAKLPAASVKVDASRASQQNVAGAKVDVLPQSLPLNAPPDYPAIARAQRQEGVVQLSVTVNARGRVETLSVIASSGHALLDQAALAAVRNWQFKPALRAGLAVSTTVQVPIRFAIRDGR